MSPARAMRSHHLVIGLGVLLALSVAVPAMGGPFAPPTRRASAAKAVSRIKRSVKATLKLAKAATQSAAGVAAPAEDTVRVAAGVQPISSTAMQASEAAQRAANSALSTAISARATAELASSEARGVQGRVDLLGPKIDSIAVTVASTNAAAQSALATAAEKFRGVQVEPSSGTGKSLGNNEKSALAECPPSTVPAGGGFKISANPAEPHFSQREVEKNSWLVKAQSGSNPFNIQAFALCLFH